MTDMPEYQVQLLEFLADVEMTDEEIFWWKRGKETRLVFAVLCSDRFYWASADAELIENALDLEGLKQARLDCIEVFEEAEFDSDWALLWICRKRGMRPQGAAYSFIPEPLWPLFHAAGPEREPEFGNPYRPGEYKRPGGPS